jgi:hypothetical protein
MRDCSIEASSASLPFRLSWNALLMSDINLERYVDAFAPLLVFRARRHRAHEEDEGVIG